MRIEIKEEYDDDGIIGQNGTEYGYLYMTGVIPSF